MKKQILILLFCCMIRGVAYSQAINPVRYYTCDNTNPVGKVLDEMGNFDLTPVGSFNIVAGGAIGKGVEYTSATDQVVLSGNPSPITASFTYECLIKPGHYYVAGNMAYDFASSWSIIVATNSNPSISFTTNTGAPNQTRSLIVDLNGVGRKSAGWLLDGNFHHLVFTYSSATGIKKIYIDGESPAGFTETVPSGNLNYFDPNPAIWMNSTVFYVKTYCIYDNLAIYTGAMTARQVYQHYLDFKAGNNYSFTENASAAPTSVITSALNPLDFPAGTVLNSVQPVTPCTTCPSALAQLKDYPLPRYKISSVGMLRNFPWFDYEYLAGKGQDGQTVTTVANMVNLQKELYTNWNYYLMANGNVQQGVDYSAITTQFTPAMANLAKLNPTWQSAAITIRLQQTSTQDSGIWDLDKSIGHYIHNAIDSPVNLNCTYTGEKYWSPVSSSLDWGQDGRAVKAGLQSLITAMSPNKLKIINENGEYIQMVPDATLNCDPSIVQDYTRQGLTPSDYYAKRALDVSTVGYRNTFMELPELKKTWFTEYAIDGHADPNRLVDYRVDYRRVRSINNPIKGRIYPTPDYYPRWPYNWRQWQSAWHGIGWIIGNKNLEHDKGDYFFSPFICAGFDKKEENNMRPAQFLGNLKCLSALGAEFFYSGYFTLSAPFDDPKNWNWQIAMAPYAQAITSRYMDCFTTGTLRTGDFPRNYTAGPADPGYSFYCGDQRKFIVCRKSNLYNKHLICGTLNPETNELGQVEDESPSTIYLSGDTLTFNVRRWGSVYIYDKRYNPPVFYQLDGWHEGTHPSRWSKDFNFEAENWDNTDDSVRFRLTSGNTGKNYTNFVTVAGTVATKWPLRYDFQPRGAVNQTYYVWIKAATAAPGTIRLKITLDDATPQFIDITGTTQTWYKLKTTGGALSYSNVTPTKHSLKIYQQTLGMRIDKIGLTTDSAKNYTN